MNIARLFVGTSSGAELIHVGNAGARVRRSAGELSANVAALSEALPELGVRSGDVVLILGGSRVEIAEAILATFNIGAIAVPVSPQLGATHLKTIIARMRPKCCVFEDEPEQSVLQALADLSSIMITIKGPAESVARGWTLYRDLVGRTGTRLVFPEHSLDHPALVIHGSGSSGALKAIALSHQRLLTFFEYNRLIFAQYSDGPDVLTSAAPMVTSFPLPHLAGLGSALLALMNGQRSFLMSAFLPEAYLKLVEEVRCSHVLLVPSLYRSLLKEPYLRKMDKSSLRFCIIGGEPSPAELLAEIEQAFAVPVVTIYSMTECMSGIAHTRRDLFTRVNPGSCGRQFFGEHSLRDAEGNEQTPFGELWVRNTTVHACYLDPALNEERLRGGWFRTGDLFFRDDEGNFFHRGRVDDMFICNGKNIYPVEIENLLTAHPAVDMVCAGPVTLPGKGPVPGALVVAKAPVSETELQELCVRQGPSHAVPQVIRFVDNLPLLGPGKIDRRGAQRLLQQPLNASLHHATP